MCGASSAGSTLWKSLTKPVRSVCARGRSSAAAYTSARLHVDTTTASRAVPRAASACRARARPRAWKSTRSRSSTGAVRWLMPTRKTCIRGLKIMALRQEIANRDQIQQHEGKAERRQIRRPPSAPADPPRREELERVHGPAHERDEDLGVVQRHRL